MATALVKPAKVSKKSDEPLSFELAEWFRASGENEVFSHDLILRKIRKIKESHGVFDEARGITYGDFVGYIKQCREYLELKHEVTLVNVKAKGESKGGYKIASEQEATLYGVRQYKRLILHCDRVRRITPLMKRKYIWPSVQRVFGKAQEETERFHRLGEKFMLAYNEDEKEFKKEQKENEKVEAAENGK